MSIRHGLIYIESEALGICLLRLGALLYDALQSGTGLLTRIEILKKWVTSEAL
jgi:hypothetical protein